MYLKLACLPVILLVIFLCIFNFKNQAIAAVSACTVTADVTSFNASTTSDITFTITNSDSTNNIARVFITRDSDNYTINTGGAASSYTDSSLAIGPGQSEQIPLSIDVGATNEGATAWSVVVSDIAGGGDNTTCSGDIQTSIVNGSEAFAISGVTVSDIAKTSVKISWTTNVGGTTLIEYGTTSSYGSSSSDGTLATSHSVTIGSLSEGVNYHYKLTSVDGDGNTATTGDNTFTTASSQTTTVTTTTTVTKTNTTTVIATDTTKPFVRISTDLSKPFNKVPKITGKASDDKSISRVEYSLDNGVNWQPVDNAILDKPIVNFDFTPPFLDDDIYKLKVRAKDSSGNIGMTYIIPITIDRLPPNVGSILFSIGPQPIHPLKDNKIYGLEGMDQKITLSAVGGPVSVDILSGNKMFSLAKNIDSGLWFGIISFENAGDYKLMARSVDGGGTKAEREIGSIVILPRGKITTNNKSKIQSVVSAYYFDQTTNQFVLWDGKAYGQQNPQKTTSDGEYGFYLPPGKYYIEIKADGYRNLKSNIFEISASMPVTSNFKLEKKIAFFDISETNTKINLSTVIDNKKNPNLLDNTLFPDVDLLDGSEIVQSNSLRGKRMLISIVNSWNPFSFQQVPILNRIAKKEEIAVVAIFPQENASRIDILKKRGSYLFPMLADQDGNLIPPLNALNLPMNIFINKNGTIKSIKYEILSESEIEENLIN